jgi:hypothetical protein
MHTCIGRGRPLLKLAAPGLVAKAYSAPAEPTSIRVTLLAGPKTLLAIWLPLVRPPDMRARNFSLLQGAGEWDPA